MAREAPSPDQPDRRAGGPPPVRDAEGVPPDDDRGAGGEPESAAPPSPPAAALPVNTLLTLARKATGLHVRSADVSMSLVRQAAAEGKSVAEPDQVSAQVEALRQDSAQILQAAIDALSQTIEQQSTQQREREERARRDEERQTRGRTEARERGRGGPVAADEEDEAEGEAVYEGGDGAAEGARGARATVRETPRRASADERAAGETEEGVVPPAPAVGAAIPFTTAADLARRGAGQRFDAEPLEQASPELGLPAPGEPRALPRPGGEPMRGPRGQVATGVDSREAGAGAEAAQVTAAAEEVVNAAGWAEVPAAESAPAAAEGGDVGAARTSAPVTDAESARVAQPEFRPSGAPISARREAIRAQLEALERRRQALAARRRKGVEEAGAGETAAPQADDTGVDAGAQPGAAADVARPAAEARMGHQPAVANANTERLAGDVIGSARDEPDEPERWDEFAVSGARRNGRALDREQVAIPVPAPQEGGEARFMRLRVEPRRSAFRRAARAVGRALPPRVLTTPFLALVLLTLAVLLTPLPEYFGWQLLPVLSGSMEPAIPVGSIVAVHPVPARDLRVGDMITFADRGNPDVLVTHRIVSLETRSGQQVAVTKGDANNTTDSWNVPLDQAVGRVEQSVPYLGYVTVGLGSPTVKLLALGLVIVLLLLPPVWGRMRGAGRTDRPPTVETEPEPTFDDLAREIDALLGMHGEGSVGGLPAVDEEVGVGGNSDADAPKAGANGRATAARGRRRRARKSV